MQAPTATNREIAAALDLIENLDALGIRLTRQRRSLMYWGAGLTDGMRAAIGRNYRGLLFVIRCREESERVLRRFQRQREWHTADRVKAYLRKQSAKDAVGER